MIEAAWRCSTCGEFFELGESHEDCPGKLVAERDLIRERDNWRAAHDAHCDVPQPCSANSYDYETHNQRGEDGPCDCHICRVHPIRARGEKVKP